MSVGLKLPEIHAPHWKWPQGFDWSRFKHLIAHNDDYEGDTERPSPPDPEQRRKRLTWLGAVVGTIALAIILFLAFFDWNMLRGPIGRFASERSGPRGASSRATSRSSY